MSIRFDSLFKNNLMDCLLRPNLCHARINVIQDILSHLTQSSFQKYFTQKKKEVFKNIYSICHQFFRLTLVYLLM